MSLRNLSRFGGRELRLIFALDESERSVFTFVDAKKILGGSVASVKNVLKRLKKKNRVIALQKGVYLFAPMKSGAKGFWSENSLVLVPYLVKGNYYVGFVAAMNYWGLTEQLPITVHVALTRQKKSLSAVQSKFIFVKKKKLGDFVTVKINETEVNVASIEQTILDALAFPHYCLGLDEAAKAIWSARNKVNWNKLIDIAKSESSAVQRRLGYILEKLNLAHYKKLRGKFVGFCWLDSKAQKRNFTYSKKWGLKVNILDSDLLEFQRGY